MLQEEERGDCPWDCLPAASASLLRCNITLHARGLSALSMQARNACESDRTPHTGVNVQTPALRQQRHDDPATGASSPSVCNKVQAFNNRPVRQLLCEV